MSTPNDEVEAMCADLERSAIEIRKAGHAGWGNTCSWSAELHRKQAAQIAALRDNEALWAKTVETRDARIVELQDECVKQAAQIAAWERDCRDAEANWKRLEAQIAELQNELLEKATPKSIADKKLDAYMTEYKPGKIANNE